MGKGREMENPGSQKKVLICEDDPETRLLLRSMLQNYGYEICGEAENGLQSINLFEENRPDVVLLDIKMPKGDGLTVLRFIRDLDTVARVVMLTGDDSPHSVQTARKLGADDYLIKTSMVDTDRFLKALGHESGTTESTEEPEGEAVADEKEEKVTQPVRRMARGEREDRYARKGSRK